MPVFFVDRKLRDAAKISGKNDIPGTFSIDKSSESCLRLSASRNGLDRVLPRRTAIPKGPEKVPVQILDWPDFEISSFASRRIHFSFALQQGQLAGFLKSKLFIVMDSR